MKFYLLPLLLITLTIFTSCSKTETAQEEELFESTALVNMTTEEEELFNLVNEHRISLGLNALIYSPEAHELAAEHNAYMISKNEISHDNFSERASKLAAETNAEFVGENVAKNFPSITGALNGWLDSPPHKSTIDGDFTHSAVSIEYNGKGKPFYTQIFYKK